MLFLLIPAFLMVTENNSPAKGIYVRLAPRHYSAQDENCVEGPIVVTVKRRSDATRLLLNGKEISQEELAPALKTALATRANWEVHVQGDENLAYADPMYVVDVINSLHAHAVILTPKLKEQIAANGCLP